MDEEGEKEENEADEDFVGTEFTDKIESDQGSDGDILGNNRKEADVAKNNINGLLATQSVFKSSTCNYT